MSDIQSFFQFQSYMDSLGLFHMDLSLSRMRKTLHTLGLTRPNFPVVHVAGTNGKGSVCTLLACIATAHGLKAGVYTSPHFVSMRERVLINGAMLSEKTWVNLARAVLAAQPEEPLTHFEVLTVLAAMAFTRAGVDVALFEAGLGGTHDATNALHTDLTVFTPISLDHTEILGHDIKHIAQDKAGAMRRGVPVISAVQKPEAWHVLCEKARILGTDLSRPVFSKPLPEPQYLKGPHQQENAALALAAWEKLTEKINIKSEEEKWSKGIQAARLPGRMQFVAGNPCFLLDGAHNPQGLKTLQQALIKKNITPCAVIFGCMQEKNYPEMFALVSGLTSGPLILPAMQDTPRAVRPYDLLCSIPKTIQKTQKIITAKNMAEALSKAAALSLNIKTPSNPVLVCGSLYLLSEFFKLHPTALQWPHEDTAPGDLQ